MLTSTMCRISLIVMWSVLAIIAQDVMVEAGSGDSDIEEQPKVRTDKILRKLHLRFDRYDYEPMNLTLQIEPISAVNEVFRDQVELTLWLHETWTDPRLDFTEMADSKTTPSIVLPVDEEMSNTFRPDTVVKSAQYFKIPRSPISHGKMVIYANGTVDCYTKIKLNLPCQSEYTLPRSRSPVSSNSPRKWVYRCTLRYGSFLRNSQSLTLRWNPTASVSKLTIPCKTQGGRGAGDCELREATAFRQAKEFFGEVYDELVGHLRFQRIL